MFRKERRVGHVGFDVATRGARKALQSCIGTVGSPPSAVGDYEPAVFGWPVGKIWNRREVGNSPPAAERTDSPLLHAQLDPTFRIRERLFEILDLSTVTEAYLDTFSTFQQPSVDETLETTAVVRGNGRTFVASHFESLEPSPAGKAGVRFLGGSTTMKLHNMDSATLVRSAFSGAGQASDVEVNALCPRALQEAKLATLDVPADFWTSTSTA